jgi:NADH:ubiquinone oxidoreductase subunit 3 (subunit A)
MWLNLHYFKKQYNFGNWKIIPVTGLRKKLVKISYLFLECEDLSFSLTRINKKIVGIETFTYLETTQMIEYLLFCFIFVLVILVLTTIISPQKRNLEKLSVYECGFDSFLSSQVTFDVNFIYIAILFLIFDIELIYLMPWAINILSIGYYGYCSIFLFLILLMFGFIIEGLRGVLDWDADIIV